MALSNVPDDRQVADTTEQTVVLVCVAQDDFEAAAAVAVAGRRFE